MHCLLRDSRIASNSEHIIYPSPENTCVRTFGTGCLVGTLTGIAIALGFISIIYIFLYHMSSAINIDIKLPLP